MTRALLRYYGIRIGLFAAAVVALMAVGLGGLWCIVLAFVISGVISYPLGAHPAPVDGARGRGAPPAQSAVTGGRRRRQAAVARAQLTSGLCTEASPPGRPPTGVTPADLTGCE